MGYDTQIQVEPKRLIKFEHGMFKNVLYVPSLVEIFLFVYHMTHTGSPKRDVFDPDSLEVSNISTWKMRVKGVANDASKAYQFSHFLPYSDPVQYQLSFEREGKFILRKHFAYDNFSINVSDPESESQNQVELVYGI